MDPIDFTQPDAGQQDDAEWLRLRRTLRSLLRWTLLALLAWAALAALMAALPQTPDGDDALSVAALATRLRDPGFQAPLYELAWNTADTLFWPVIVVAAVMLLRGLLGEVMLRRIFDARRGAAAQDPMPMPMTLPDHGAQQDNTMQGAWRIATLVLQTLRIVPMALAGFAAIWAVMAAYAFADGMDALEALPWVTPPYVKGFLDQHPQFTVQRGADSSGMLTLRDSQGRSMRLHGSELTGAQARFESCPAMLSASELGGIPPYANMPCTLLAHLRNAQGQHRYFVFVQASASDTRAVKAHFEAWSDAHSSGSGSSSSKGRFSLSATSRDEAWHVQVDSSQGGATTVVIRQRTEATR
jgi:hypothetical protein